VFTDYFQEIVDHLYQLERRRTVKKHCIAVAVCSALLPLVSSAAPSAATHCPPMNVGTVNLAINSSFEVCGVQKNWKNGDLLPAASAASGWYMHSDNNGVPVMSECVATHAPGPSGTKMLHYEASGAEGGIYQDLANAPAKVMLSAWVFVRKGHVSMQAQAGNTGPGAWSTKIGQWQQLRVCSDGTVPTGMWSIYNSDPAGGEFYVDRVEVLQIP
jgi:hypothetical protein